MAKLIGIKLEPLVIFPMTKIDRNKILEQSFKLNEVEIICSQLKHAKIFGTTERLRDIARFGLGRLKSRCMHANASFWFTDTIIIIYCCCRKS